MYHRITEELLNKRMFCCSPDGLNQDFWRMEEGHMDFLKLPDEWIKWCAFCLWQRRNFSPL